MKFKKMLVAVLFLFVMNSVFNPALAKQCIYNKAGFILNISWIQNGNIVRKNQIALGQGNCSDDNGINYTVVLSIQDGKLASDFTKGFIAVAGTVLGAVIEGPYGAGTGATIAALANLGIPDAKEIFYVDVPRSDRYLDVWGTVWSPQTGYGGSI